MANIYDESYAELKEFAEWFNHIFGHHPIIIGGWAVYHYNGYFQSKDIDVVFEFPRKAWDPQILTYFGTHGYDLLGKDRRQLPGSEITAGFTESFRKQTETEPIYVDVCSFHDKNGFFNKDYSNKDVPYALIKNESMDVVMKDSKAAYRVPKIELLLLYKLKAYNDRKEKAKVATSQEEIQYFESKRDKDGSDIIALLDSKNSIQKVDFNHLRELVDKLGINGVVRQTIDDVFINGASVSKYNKLNQQEITALSLKARKEVGRASREESEKFLKLVIEEFKSKVGELPSAKRRKFPFYAFPATFICALTGSKLYLFLAPLSLRVKNKHETMVFDHYNLPKLDSIMDDEEEYKPIEVAQLVKAPDVVFQWEAPNFHGAVSEHNVEYMTKLVYNHLYRKMSKGESLIEKVAEEAPVRGYQTSPSRI